MMDLLKLCDLKSCIGLIRFQKLSCRCDFAKILRGDSETFFCLFASSNPLSSVCSCVSRKLQMPFSEDCAECWRIWLLNMSAWGFVDACSLSRSPVWLTVVSSCFFFALTNKWKKLHFISVQRINVFDMQVFQKSLQTEAWFEFTN